MTASPLVYLAHPIDFADPTQTRALVERIAYSMQAASLNAYVPGYAFITVHGANATGQIGAINRAALTEADALIAVLPKPGVTSIGVPMEIEMAREQNKPMLIVGHPTQLAGSWALPRTDLVLFSEEPDEASVASLASLVARVRRNRNRPPASRALYTRLDPGAILPSRAYSGDAGFDLYTQEETLVPAGQFVDVPVGCAVQFPDDVWGLIIGRSSTVRKLDLMVVPGVIDTGYRGPLFAGTRSLRDDDYIVKKGERIAQLIPFPNLAQGMHATPVDVLASSDRGEAGFGSSGA